MSFQEQGVAKGYGVELVELLAKRLNVDANIEVLPWARAYSIAASHPDVMLFATSLNDERRKQFDFIGPIATSRIYIYAKASDDVQLDDILQVDQLGSVGVYRGSIGESILMQVGVKHLTVASFPQQSAKQLMHGRIRFWCQADLSVSQLLNEVSMAESMVKPVFELSKIDLYLGFSKGTSPQVVNQWYEALKKLQSEGGLAKLYQVWFHHSNAPTQIHFIERQD
ncbi:transporter substrate-binding domain-containing protein [Shewanella mesophila]|nr:transporter substrate-binding domain-containing protein [Shewanella mesophila]